MTRCTILIFVGILSTAITTVQSEFQSAPVPGTPEPDRSSPPPKLLANFIPASMQLLQHCIESIQYEPVTPSMTMTTTTTAKPTTTTAAAPAPQQRPTVPHKPGYFGPAKPPPLPPSSSSSGGTIPSTSASQQTTTTKPSTETAETLLWNDKQFFEWFLQSKYKQIKLDNDYNLQLLDPLPLRLLQDIEGERYELPALLDKDNVNEFRKIYDDKYRESETDSQQMSNVGGNKPHLIDNRHDSWTSITAGSISSPNKSAGEGAKGSGRKRVPPTKPYIHMLMLYDLLKREAKKFMFNLYEGFSPEILTELSQFKADNSQQQLLFVLSRMLEEKNIDKADVVSRTKAMITELENPNSAITKALIYVPPLVFAA